MEKKENKKELDKDIKAFYENNDVISKERLIDAMRTTYIDLIADGTPNISIYGVINAKQETKEKQELANYYKSLFENILTTYNKVYKYKDNGGRPFDNVNLVIATTLKDAFINSLILAQTKDENATKINPKSNLYVDAKDLTIERLATRKDFEGNASLFSMFNNLYLEYGQALADLTILRIIGQVLGCELIGKDEIVEYFNCTTYEDLSTAIDKIIYVLENEYKDNNEYKKSNFYIDLITTKAINYKFSILLDSDELNKDFMKVEQDIKKIILKQTKEDGTDLKIKEITESTPYIKVERTNYAIQPYELTTKIRRFLTSYYWNRIKKEIRGVAESEASYGK